MVVAANGNIPGLVQYLLVQNGMLPKVVAEQAKGLQNLNPRINVWNTQKQDQGSVENVLNNLVQGCMPLFSQVKDQTGRDFLSSLGVPENKVVHDDPREANSLPKNKV